MTEFIVTVVAVVTIAATYRLFTSTIFRAEAMVPCDYWESAWIVVYQSLLNEYYGASYDMVMCKDHIFRDVSTASQLQDIQRLAVTFADEENAKQHAREASARNRVDFRAVRAAEHCRRMLEDSQRYSARGKEREKESK